MKLLILSFFGTLLIYSFFFDKEENKGNQDLRLRPDSVNYEQKVLRKQVDSVSTLRVQPTQDILSVKMGNERAVCLQESVSWNFRQEFTTTLGIVYFTTDMAYAVAYNQIPHVQRHVVTDYLFKYILRDFHGWSFVLHNHLRLQ